MQNKPHESAEMLTIKSLVCIGDSLTAGYGVHKNKCWLELLRSEVPFQIINKGVNGDTTSGMLSRSYKDVILNNPSHVFIMGGTNDFLTGFPVNNTFNNLKHLAEEAVLNSIIPFLACPLPLNTPMAERLWDRGLDYELVNVKLSELSELLEQYAKENNFYFINFFKIFKKITNSDNVGSYYIDGIHPTISGHKLIMETVKMHLIEKNKE